MSAELLREAAAKMQQEAQQAVRRPYAREERVAEATADFLNFAAAFADQPQPYSPTVDHAVKIARAHLERDA